MAKRPGFATTFWGQTPDSTHSIWQVGVEEIGGGERERRAHSDGGGEGVEMCAQTDPGVVCVWT
jgi:hypothetical protein